MATLINGNGNPAIYAQQDADFYNGIMGPRTRILNVGSKMAATIEDANTIAIADGVIITKEGRRVQVDVGNVDEFIIPTGQAGTTRYYIIGYHLYTDGSANQLCETFVQLMASGSETITEDEFREGATEVYVSLYRIEQTGLTLNDPEALLTVGDSVSQIEDDIDDIEGDIAQINSDLTELTTYSETEHIVGKWIDGKPVYQKVISFGNLPSNTTTKAVNHNISNLEHFVDISVIAYAGNQVAINVPHADLAFSGQVVTYVTNAAVYIQCGMNRSNYVAYAILKYTKTTD